MSDVPKLLRDACKGHPYAKIPWPHQLLHGAAEHIEELEAEIERLKASPWRDTAEELPDPVVPCLGDCGDRLMYKDCWYSTTTGAMALAPKQWAYITDLLPDAKDATDR